jgi:ankyrin repeat protein
MYIYFINTADQESPVGHTALSIASFNGHNDTVRALLIRNEDHSGAGAADVNYESTTGYTPLLQTCISGHANTARILLNNGADPNLQNKQSETALTTAARCGHADVVMALVRSPVNFLKSFFNFYSFSLFFASFSNR